MENNVSMDRVAEKVLDRKTFTRTVFRSLALQGCFNFERMQAIGWCFTLLPVLRKLYPEKEQMSEALKRHVGFFNTSPQFCTFIFGIVIAMEEQNKNQEDFDASSINAIKAALMGPLAGIGDSFFWGTIRIIGAGIGTGLAIEGNFLGVIIFILMFNIPHYILRFGGLKLGYERGMTFIQKVYQEGIIEKLTSAAKTLGTFVVGAMIASMVRVSTPLVFEFNGAETVMQDMFDNILPGMLPLGLTFLVYYLVKKGLKMTTVMLGLMLLGILGVVIGIL